MAQAVRRSKRLQVKRELKESLAAPATVSPPPLPPRPKTDPRTQSKDDCKDSKDSKGQPVKYWLMKSEPTAYSIDDLEAEGEAGDYWDGIRNYQVRNLIRDEIRCGDVALFYHSCCKPPGVAGTMSVLKECYPDFTAFDQTEKYFDPKSDRASPRWFMFDVGFRSKFKNFVTLKQLKETKELEAMKTLQKGNRLSITQITKEQFECIERLGNQ